MINDIQADVRPLPPEATNPSGTPKPSRFLNLAALKQLPPLEWLISELLETASLAMLYGAPGSLKTFLALDWALSVATDQAWHGRQVRRGKVIYLCGEGRRGILKRVEAWMKHRGIESVDDLLFDFDVFQLRTPEELQRFMTDMAGEHIQPALIVIDPFARSFDGDENNVQDVEQWLRAAARLQELGATVLFVHHTVKNGKRGMPTERGSSALRGRIETAISIHRKGDQIIVTCTKQKNDEEFPRFALNRQTVALENGKTSCVLVPTNMAAEPLDQDDTLSPALQTTLDTLASFPARGSTSNEDWQRAVEEREGSSLTRAAFQKRLKALKDARCIVQLGPGRYKLSACEVSEKHHENSLTHPVAA